MRVLAILLTFSVALCGALAAEEERPPVSLPVYPGSETTMEINLTAEDIQPMLEAMLPFASAGLGELAEVVRPEDVGAVFADVKRIEFLQLDLAARSVTEAGVASFYAKNLPSGRWRRVYFRSSDAGGTMAVYAQGDIEGVYGFRVHGIDENNKPIRRIEVARIEGRIDFAKLFALAGKAVMLFGGMSSVSSTDMSSVKPTD